MTKRILVMGLPGSGKTYLAQHILEYLQDAYIVNENELAPFNKVKVGWLNADDVRKKYNDWDFSHEGRIRQSMRMRELADSMTDMDYVICDFIAPLVEMRNNFAADCTIWIDTIKAGRYEDTNAAFVPPRAVEFRVTEQNAEKWVTVVLPYILDLTASHK